MTPPIGHWYFPGTEDTPPAAPHKCDHIAFHVDSKEDIEFFMKRLDDHGIPYVGPFEPRHSPARFTRYTHRIYFYDPSGNPLEMATLPKDEGPEVFELDLFMLDEDPVPAALEEQEE